MTYWDSFVNWVKMVFFGLAWLLLVLLTILFIGVVIGGDLWYIIPMVSAGLLANMLWEPALDAVSEVSGEAPGADISSPLN